MRSLALVFQCTLLAGCATMGSGGANVPNLALEDTRGRTHFLTDHIGQKVTVMSFWATWCQPCRQELLLLEEIYKEHKDEGFMVLAINTDGPETQAAVRAFVVQQGLSYPVLLDPDTRAVALYNPRKQMPMLHIFSKTGRIVFSHSTFQPGEREAIKKKILSVLAGRLEEPREVKEEKGGDDKNDKRDSDEQEPEEKAED